MADENDNLGPLIADLAKYGVSTGGAIGANAATQSAYAAVLKNLQDRFNDYSNLSPADYQKLVAQQLGPSALSQIQPDAQSRIDQQDAIAQLDDIAKSGGLTLADKQALNKLEQQLSRGAGARTASLANQFAARGQLGSGQQLAMSLDANQNAAQNANDRGESIAAQAQQRAMDAVLKKSSASRAMSNDDYARKQRAAEAADSISRFNSNLSMDVQRGNNTLLGQTYDDKLKKLYGQTGLTNSMNTAILGSGKQNADTIDRAAYGGTGIIETLSKYGSSAPKSGGGGSGDTSFSAGENAGESGATGAIEGAAGATGGGGETDTSSFGELDIPDDEGVA